MKRFLDQFLLKPQSNSTKIVKQITKKNKFSYSLSIFCLKIIKASRLDSSSLFLPKIKNTFTTLEIENICQKTGRRQQLTTASSNYAIILFINFIIANLRIMKSLQEFASNDNQPFFAQAKTLPQFFHQNLVDPARVVKAFHNDPQANIRIFYYQYLKLCFELDNVNYESYINKIQQIINNQAFKFIFYEDDDPSLFSDLQFKNLIMQFFGVLGDGNITIDAAVNRYPVMDTVFIYFFRAFLILTGKAQTLDSYVERDELLQYLCSYFQVEITLHDRCIKFVQTDIFAYEQDPKEVFMAYMDYQRVQNESQLEPPQQDIPHNLQENHQNYNYNPQEMHGLVSSLDQHAQANQPEFYSHEEISPQNHEYYTKGYEFPPKAQLQIQHVQNGTNYPTSNGSSHRVNTQINRSYIASEFVDYTSGVGNLAGLGGNLKDSGSVDSYKYRQQPIVKTDIFAYNYEENMKKPTGKPIGLKIQSQKQPNQYLTYGSNIKNEGLSYSNYNFEQDKISTYNTAYLNSDVGSYLAKTNFSVQTTYKQANLQENKYIPQKDWEPTKDPGFSSKYNNNQYISSSSYQQPASPANSYQPISTYYEPSNYIKALEQKKPSSQSLHTSDSLQQLQIKKPISSEVTKTPIISNYTPNYQIGSYQSQYSEQVAAPKPSSKNNPFGLNVSLEFTNSFTMKAMNQPYRSNVASIRQKARTFRNSLISYMK